MRKLGAWIGLWMLLLTAGCGLLVEEGREVVAEVGGESIRLDDLLRRIRELPFQERAKTNDADQTVRMQARLAVLEELVVQELFLQEVRARGIQVSDEEVYAALEEDEAEEAHSESAHMEGEPETHDHGHSHEHPREDLRRMRNKLAITKLLTQQFPEEALRSYYQSHAQEFRIVPRLIYELLVVDAAHRDAVDAIYPKLKAGAPMADALGTLQQPPPTLFLGLTPPTPLEKLAPEMRERVKNLKVGEVSEPFYLNPGAGRQYAVARFVARMDVAPFDQVREQVFNRMYRDFVEGLKTKYHVVYHKDKLGYELGR
ncbi:MAG: hypothetical protein Kow0099_16580 [Candidatus Abyssubacteria bacterium]